MYTVNYCDQIVSDSQVLAHYRPVMEATARHWCYKHSCRLQDRYV
jgi:hypothetical protein